MDFENTLAENANIEYRFINYIKKTLKHAKIKYDIRNRKISLMETLFDDMSALSGLDITDDCTNNALEAIAESSSCSIENIFTDKKLYLIVKNLSQKEKDILFLKYVKEMTDCNIASALNISQQATTKAKNKILSRILRQYNM